MKTNKRILFSGVALAVLIGACQDAQNAGDYPKRNSKDSASSEEDEDLEDQYDDSLDDLQSQNTSTDDPCLVDSTSLTAEDADGESYSRIGNIVSNLIFGNNRNNNNFNNNNFNNQSCDFDFFGGIVRVDRNGNQFDQFGNRIDRFGRMFDRFGRRIDERFCDLQFGGAFSGGSVPSTSTTQPVDQSTTTTTTTTTTTDPCGTTQNSTSLNFTELKPVIDAACVGCHGDLATVDAWRTKKSSLLSQIESRSMPTPNGPVLQDADRTKLLEWLRTL